MPSWPKLTTDDPDEENVGPWPMVWVIVIAKVATLVVILVYAWGGEATALIGATMLPWLVVAIVLLSAPVAWQIRLRRARMRRKAMLDAEWMVETADPKAPMPVARESRMLKRPHRRH